MSTCITPQTYTPADPCGPLKVPYEIPHWFTVPQPLAQSGDDMGGFIIMVLILAGVALAVGTFMWWRARHG